MATKVIFLVLCVAAIIGFEFILMRLFVFYKKRSKRLKNQNDKNRKGMSKIEEKAKAYDEAMKKLRTMRDAWNNLETDYSPKDVVHDIEYYFPELAESEEGKIKKIIKQSLKSFFEGKLSSGTNDVDYAMCLTWLEKQGEHANFRNKIQIGDKVTRNEDGVLINLSQLNRVAKKQGEQKPTDKVEPKFKFGDWLVRKDKVGVVFCITQIHAPHYYLTNNNSFIKFCEEDNYRPWTIQDAKDGDVLYFISDSGIEYIVMNKGINRYNNVDSYFRYNSIDGFGVDIPSVFSANDDSITPATKEQRDLLFQKMKEAGYEWNAEKKELKKIEQTPVFEMKTSEESLGIDSDTYNKIVDECVYGEQKPAEWSEEDELRLNYIIQFLEDKDRWKDTERAFPIEEDVRWLKFLRERYIWKPSLAQLNALSIVSKGCAPDYIEAIVSLYNELKKLKE